MSAAESMHSNIGGPGVASFTVGNFQLVWSNGCAWMAGAKDQAGRWVHRSTGALPTCRNAQEAHRAAVAFFAS